MAAVTALQGLRAARPVVAGERVLVHGASGGVGTFAVPLDWSQQAQHAIPDARLRVSAQSGHWPLREEPEVFIRTLAASFRDS